jgi:hypothetical protein
MLVVPFDQTKAYKLNIIDENGKVLKKASTLKTQEERDAYNYLTRLVFNIKRMVNRLPGGESRLKNIVSAYFLVRECYEKRTSTTLLEGKLRSLVNTIEKNNIIMVEEELLIQKFSEEVSAGVANVTGSGVATDEPVIKKKKREFIDVKRRREKLQQ